jgi:outer membrane receptor for ferric coprogen and ferric-rhodotorulic acid
MKFNYPKFLNRLPVLLPCFALPFGLQGQDEDGSGPVFELSPFEVSASGDSGYLATNTISGTSLNIAIRDLPMSLEAITAEFLEDTGATSFAEALAYSSGVFTSQFTESNARGRDGANSPGANRSYSGDRSPSSRAGTGGRFANGVIIRGFNVPFQNLDGFRYGGMIASYGVALGGILDSSNIERMEVVRGPNSLLYGTGVLSGIVNVIPRRPLEEQRQSVRFTMGNYGFRRAQVDVTGPISNNFAGGSLQYRAAAAFEDRGSWTQFNEQELEYYVGQLQYRSKNIVALAEIQYADAEHRGIGNRHIYDNLNGAINDAFRNEYGEQYSWGRDFGGMPESSRVTGSDTYHWRRELNIRGNIDWTPFKGFAVSAGSLYTEADEELFDMNVSTLTNLERNFSIPNFVGNLPADDSVIDNIQDPVQREQVRQQVNSIRNFLQDYVTVFPASDEYIESLPPAARSADLNDYKVVRYWWRKRPTMTRTAQYRIRATYNFETPFLFDSEASHTFLVGRHDIKDTAEFFTGNERLNNQFLRFEEFEETGPLQYRRIDDYTPIRYDGEMLAMPGREHRRIQQWFTGHYGLYQGQFFSNRLTTIAGVRHDRYHSLEKVYRRVNEVDGANFIEPSGVFGSGYVQNPNSLTDGFVDQLTTYAPNAERAESEVTKTLAAGFRIIDPLSIYGLVSEGVTPNTGLRDGNYQPIDSEKSRSQEIGIKFDLIEGKISGTLSVYRIRRENAVWQWANAPSPSKWGGSGSPEEAGSSEFNPNQLNHIEGSGRVPLNYGVDESYFDFDLGQITSPGPGGRPVITWPKGIYTVESHYNGGSPIDALRRDLVFLDYEYLDEPALDRNGDPTGHTWRYYLEKAFADTERSRRDNNSQNGPDDIDPIRYVRTPNTFGGLNASTNSATGANVTYTDEATGFDFQVILTPNSNLQLILNYARTKREAISPFKLASTQGFGSEYDVWVRTFGREAFGLKEWDINGDGVVDYITRADAVGDNPTESELQAAQVGQGDFDTTEMVGGLQGTSLFFGSEEEFSFWAKYSFDDGLLDRLSLGFGGNFTGPAATSVAIGGDDLADNRFRTPATSSRWSFDAMAQYRFYWQNINWSVRLNVYNIFNDTRGERIVSYEDPFDGSIEQRRTLNYYTPRNFRLSVSASF